MRVGIISLVLIVAAAGTARTELTRDQIIAACKTLTLRECMKLQPDLGISDNNCYPAHKESAKLQKFRSLYTVEDCRKGNILLRERLLSILNKTVANTQESRCVQLQGKLKLTRCVAVPSDEILDAPPGAPALSNHAVQPSDHAFDNYKWDNPTTNMQLGSAFGSLQAHPELMALPGATNTTVGYDDHGRIAIIVTSTNPNAAKAAAPAMVDMTPVVIQPALN